MTNPTTEAAPSAPPPLPSTAPTASPSEAEARSALPPPAPPVPSPTPELFGLTEDIPSEPAAAFAAVLAADQPDAVADQGTFALRVRRALRFGKLKALKVHATLPTPLDWEAFVEKYYAGGYDVWHRSQRSAAVQQQLYDWKLPLAPTEKHCRILAPRLRVKSLKAGLRKILNATGGYPSAAELDERLARPSRRTDPLRKAARLCDALIATGVWDAGQKNVLASLHHDVTQRAQASAKKKTPARQQPLANEPAAADGHQQADFAA